MLLGKYVGLRAIEPSDLPKLMEWRNNPDYRKYFREHRELNSDMQEAWYKNTVCNDPKTIMFSIVELSSNRLLGATGLCYINWVCKNADFSIYLGADDLYIDEKLAVDTARILIKYAFEELAIHRVWAEIYDFDVPKQKMFKTLGFTLDGRHRETYWHDNKWHDSLFYSLLCIDRVK